MRTNKKRLEELKKTQKELRDYRKGKSISIWKFWKIRDDQVLLATGEKLLRVNEEITIIYQTLERAKAEAKNKQKSK